MATPKQIPDVIFHLANRLLEYLKNQNLIVSNRLHGSKTKCQGELNTGSPDVTQDICYNTIELENAPA